MNKVKHYAEELNILCVCICLMVVTLYWIQQISPNLYAFIQTLIESLDPLATFNGVNPESPTDFVNKI